MDSDEEEIVLHNRPFVSWFAWLAGALLLASLWLGPHALIVLVFTFALGVVAVETSRPLTFRIRASRVEVSGWLGQHLPRPDRRAFDLADVEVIWERHLGLRYRAVWILCIRDGTSSAIVQGTWSSDDREFLETRLRRSRERARERHGAGRAEIPQALAGLRARAPEPHD